MGNESTVSHNWKHRGICPPSHRGSLWDSWVRIVSSFALGVLSTVYFLGGKSRDVSDLVAWKTTYTLEQATWKKSIEDDIKRLDREGTNKSKVMVEHQQKELERIAGRQGINEERISKLERADDAIPAMQQKLQRLEDEIVVHHPKK